jgi:hypothetical protein
MYIQGDTTHHGPLLKGMNMIPTYTLRWGGKGFRV